MNARALLPAIRPDRLIMAIVFAGAIIGGWVLLPGENERVAMLERDGHSAEALAILEQQVNGGDRRYRTLHQILALYENEGNVGKAQAILEDMVKERPRDAALKRRLAQFYKNSQKDGAYIATLHDIIDLRYSESTCRELIGRLRFKGDAAAEQQALQRCRQKGYRRPEDLSRLAELVAADGDKIQAAALLKSIDDLKRLKTTRERYQLLQLLVEQDQPKDAERRALRWIRSAKDDAMAIGLIDLLARSKFPDSAIEVAKDSGSPGDSISLTVAERLIEKTQSGAAILYLRGWLERAQGVEPETAVRFVDAALAAGDARTALKGARQFGLAQLPEQTLRTLAAALDGVAAKAEADEVRGAMTDGAPPGTSQAPAGAAAAGVLTGAQAPLDPQAGPGRGPLASRSRTVLLVDPLDQWRRSLHASMTTDAQRRMQALFVGPKPPPGYVSGNADGRGRDARAGARGGGAKLLKKTSRVLQRSKKLSTLRAKRRFAKQPNGLPSPKGQLPLGQPAGKSEPAGDGAP
ncbi:MAG: hypothetical protein HOP09_00745 [Hyphomicrobium sp.]|nr:hypothetical protein [Hyphomicrobium sp.]